MINGNDNLKITDNTFARNEGSRIAYYHINSAVKADFWSNHWTINAPTVLKDLYHHYRYGYRRYEQVQRTFLKHLPREGIILEGGCGLGQYVNALRSRGYNCIGVDFSSKVVEMVKAIYPDMPIIVDDICRLSGFETGSVAAYISLGVMEHFQDGPHEALKEALRVLRRNGVLIISVPLAFRWRRLSVHPEGTPLPDNACFYQYAFAPEEFRDLLINSGFRIQAEYGYALHYAFRLRFKFIRNLLRRFPQLAHIDLLIDRIPIGVNLARMRLYVAIKEDFDA